MTSTNHTALLPVEQIDKDLADLIMMMDQLPYDRARDWLVTKLAAHRLQAPAEAGEEVERVARAIGAAEFGGTDGQEPDWMIPWEEQPEEQFGEWKASCRRKARAAITALRANAPEAGEVERVLALVPNAYADIKLNLPDAVICYGMDTGGCVREAGCEDTCLMLATYRKGVEFGARAALTSGAGD